MRIPSPAEVYRSSVSWGTGVLQRLIGYGLEIYAAGGGGIPVDPAYQIAPALKSAKQNPWVYVCLQAIATDLASLPIIAVRGPEGEEEQLKDHWLPALLARPHPKTSSIKFRKQIYADLRLGDAFIRVWRDESGQPFQFARVIPTSIQPIVADDGEEVGWKIGASTILPWEDVLHISDFSFNTDERVVLGASPIEALKVSLQVDLDSRKQSGRTARRGRIEMIGSPKSDQIVLSKERLEAVTRNYDETIVSGNGLFLANQGLDFTPVTYLPRDGEFLEQGKMTKAEILAAFQVPGVRAGDSSTNYGTAKQQMRTYWEGLVGWAALIDAELTRLCEPGVKIRHSFARVEALQTSYTERQTRALSWARDFGVDRLKAVQYEGFVDAPVPAGAYEPIAAAPKPDSPAAHGNPPTDEPREDKIAPETLRALVHALMTASVLRAATGEDQEGRAQATADDIENAAPGRFDPDFLLAVCEALHDDTSDEPDIDLWARTLLENT